MSSPLGHAFAGVATVWASDLIPGSRSAHGASPGTSWLTRAGGTITVVCAGLAVLPDVDLAFNMHRSVSHSLTAVAAVTILSAAVTGWVTRRSERTAATMSIARVALVCGAAYGSHLLVDWLAVDPTPPIGIQLFWPFSHNWYLSGLNLLPRTERRELFAPWSIRVNLLTAAWESAVFLPILGLLWFVREKTLARLAAETSGRNHPAE